MHKTMWKNLQKSLKKHRKCIPKSSPEASRTLWRAKLAPGGSENRSRRPSSAKKKTFDAPKRPQREFPSPESVRLSSTRDGPAGCARPVKAYPGGFRPGKTRLNGLKHAHHRKRWSADNRFATPGGHPGLEGSRASNFQKQGFETFKKQRANTSTEAKTNKNRTRNE